MTGPVDVVHAPTFAVPPGGGAPLVVTVHDLAFLRDPQHFTRNGLRFFHRGLAITRREADLVLCPSQATADDCEHAGIEPSRLRVVPHGVDERSVAIEEIQAFRRRHGIQRPYVLWCGTHEPRKNVARLLEAFAEVIATGEDLDLVLVGPTGWGRTSPPTPDIAQRVHVLGFLSDAELRAAYSGADVFAYPSLWEGFGLPVLEAMAHGVPVVTSRGTAMAEVTGDAAILVDPLSPEAIAEGLLEASGPARDLLTSAGRRRAARFTWDDTAAQVAAAYRDAARP